MKKLCIILLLVAMFFKAEATPFVTEWNIPTDSYELKFLMSGDFTLYDYDMSIDWGDGTKSHNTFEHTYKKKGTYFIKITGKLPGIILGYFIRTSKIYTQPSLITVISWGDNEWLTMAGMFYGCTSFQTIKAKDQPNLRKVSSMAEMFSGATRFNGNIADWDVSNIKNMNGMFSRASNFDQNIGKWNVSNVQNMGFMFTNALNFDQDIGRWDVSNVKSMIAMFNKATSFDKNLGRWDTSKITDMSGLFEGAEAFDQSLEHWSFESIEKDGMSRILKNSHLSISNYESTLKGWAENPNTPKNVEFNAEGLEYKDATYRDKLIKEKGWTIKDDRNVG